MSPVLCEALVAVLCFAGWVVAGACWASRVSDDEDDPGDETPGDA